MGHSHQREREQMIRSLQITGIVVGTVTLVTTVTVAYWVFQIIQSIPLGE
jgi:hypothetical protein